MSVETAILLQCLVMTGWVAVLRYGIRQQKKRDNSRYLTLWIITMQRAPLDNLSKGFLINYYPYFSMTHSEDGQIDVIIPTAGVSSYRRAEYKYNLRGEE